MPSNVLVFWASFAGFIAFSKSNPSIARSSKHVPQSAQGIKPISSDSFFKRHVAAKEAEKPIPAFGRS